MLHSPGVVASATALSLPHLPIRKAYSQLRYSYFVTLISDVFLQNS